MAHAAHAHRLAFCVAAVCAAVIASPAAGATGVFVIAERGAPPQTTIWCADAGSEVARHAAGIEVRTWRVPKALDYGTGYELSQWAMSFFRSRFASKGATWLPELIFSSDDHLTTGMLAAFYEAGIRIPDDVQLVTLSNLDYGPVFPRPLTRMEYDTSAIGKTMTGSILSYLQTGEFPQGIVVGPKYVRGETF